VSAEPAVSRFTPSPGVAFATVTGACAVIAVALAKYHWVPILDDANLVFHEAGHPIFGILGETLGLYGGTLGQLVFPVTVAVTYWRREQFLGVALGSLWFFENGLNIARYMADARAQVLPLVGGGEHDWFNIFSRWGPGALAHDTTIARVVAFLCWMGLLATWLLTLLWWMNRRNARP
jgi:hypothetical protein